MMRWSHLILTLEVLVSWLACGGSQHLSDYPMWPASCNFTKHDGIEPRAEPFSTLFASSVAECVGLCKEESRCGMCLWLPVTGGVCYRYQHSVEMWRRSGLPVVALVSRGDKSTLWSKECQEKSVHGECNQYEQYVDGKTPTTGFITRITASSLTVLGGCLKLCGKFSLCTSVTHHQVEGGGGSWCDLYSSPTKGGVVECSRCGTYTRYCDTGPYVPSNNTASSKISSTSSLLITNLILLGLIISLSGH